MPLVRCCTALVLLALAAPLLQAAVAVNPLFADGAVLQQGMPVPVWGTARDGEVVRVEFQGQTVSATAREGRWRADLAPLQPGGPFPMTIRGDNTLVLQDILVGEVWVCSGQSNMERELGPRRGQKPLVDWEKSAAEANYPQIRHFGVAQRALDQAVSAVTGTWQVCTPKTAPSFTAVGFYFARALNAHFAQTKAVPIGLLHSSWGGTPAQAWTSTEALAGHPRLKAYLDNQTKAEADFARKLAAYQAEEPKLLAAYEADAAKAKAEGKAAPRKPTPPKDPRTGNSRPAGLYNGMIAPLIPYAVRGALWYQGESNNGQPELYRELLPTLVTDWRKAWGVGAFPFLYVQIAPYKTMSPEIREAQFLAWPTIPKSALVVTTDCGDAEDIHPTNKAPVGERLALAARALAYGEPIEYSGPAYDRLTVDGAKAVLSFTHVGKGLVAKDGALKGFTIAGADGKFLPAEAVIAGATVVVTSAAVPQPVAVRYGWTNVPDVNLFNQEGLPASPFRTDAPAAKP